LVVLRRWKVAEMFNKIFHSWSQIAIGALLAGSSLMAQQASPPMPPPGQTLAPDQLNDLVAPIALYPDPLLGQILVASTYPLEVVEVSQWLQRNRGLTGAPLAQAAKQQNWDASIQALAVFPDLVAKMNQDITWTTNLGNAFLNQQPEVMDAVQHMRASAQQNGRLESTPQQTVTTSNSEIQIQPAQPDVVYLPQYNPVSIWGPPLFYPYASWYYPSYGSGVYFGWGLGIPMGLYFGGGWGGWGGWGWRPGWGGHNIYVNNNFIHRNNFSAGRGGSLSGRSNWSHDSSHRQGVPYSNSAASARYGGAARQNLQSRASAAQARGSYSQSGGERMGNRQLQSSTPSSNRSAFGGVREGAAARTHSDHGYSSMGAGRSGGGGGGRMGGGGGGGGHRGH
jgi:hypothetical protein